MASTKALNCSHALALSFEHSHEVQLAEGVRYVTKHLLVL